MRSRGSRPAQHAPQEAAAAFSGFREERGLRLTGQRRIILPWGLEHKRDSHLGRTGAIAPVFAPLGFGNWAAAASLITGAVAKEVVVGTMREIYAPAGAGPSPLRSAVAGAFTPLSAIAFQ